MNPRTRINIILLLLVIILALVTLYKPGKEHTKALPPLTNLQPEQIHLIRIHNQSGEEIVLERIKGQWQMTHPQQTPANHTKIKQLLGITTTPSHTRFPQPQGRLHEFGLNPAPISLYLNTTLLEFGTNDPIHFRRYVRLGDELNLISNGFHHHLVASAADFIAIQDRQQPTATNSP